MYTRLTPAFSLVVGLLTSSATVAPVSVASAAPSPGCYVFSRADGARVFDPERFGSDSVRLLGSRDRSLEERLGRRGVRLVRPLRPLPIAPPADSLQALVQAAFPTMGPYWYVTDDTLRVSQSFGGAAGWQVWAVGRSPRWRGAQYSWIHGGGLPIPNGAPEERRPVVVQVIRCPSSLPLRSRGSTDARLSGQP